MASQFSVKSLRMMIAITLNGEQREVESGTTLSTLIQGLDMQGKRFAIEVNEELVPRSKHSEHQLLAGDQVEIVHAIGGG